MRGAAATALEVFWRLTAHLHELGIVNLDAEDIAQAFVYAP